MISSITINLTSNCLPFSETGIRLTDSLFSFTSASAWPIHSCSSGAKPLVAIFVQTSPCRRESAAPVSTKHSMGISIYSINCTMKTNTYKMIKNVMPNRKINIITASVQTKKSRNALKWLTVLLIQVKSQSLKAHVTQN